MKVIRTTRKEICPVLWVLCFILVAQGLKGCTYSWTEYQYATITLDENTPNERKKKLRFTIFNHHDDYRYLRELLQKLDAGEDVDTNQPDERKQLPIVLAIRFDLEENKSFDVTRYLVAHYADVNAEHVDFFSNALPHLSRNEKTTAIHVLCASLLLGDEEAGIKTLALFLSYGARLDIQKRGQTPIKCLESYKPWISRGLREQYEEKRKPKPAPALPQEDIVECRPDASEYYEKRQQYSLSAWKTCISKKEQKNLKKQYLTKVARELIKLDQHHSLDPKFWRYIQKACVDKYLWKQVKARQTKY